MRSKLVPVISIQSFDKWNYFCEVTWELPITIYKAALVRKWWNNNLGGAPNIFSHPQVVIQLPEKRNQWPRDITQFSRSVLPWFWHRNRTSASYTHYRASLLAQLVKNLPAVQETRVQSLGQEDSLEKGTAAYSSILAWRMSQTEEPGGLQPMGLQRVRHDWVTNMHAHTHTHEKEQRIY